MPRTLQTKLPQLLGLLQRKGYATDPQIMFGAVGDATCDRVPLQVGQFESDNRMDEDLAKIVLEGGGGGQRTESYELAMYFMARHTGAGQRAKRGRRGYLFLIGDEMAYPQVKPQEVQRVIGDDLARADPGRGDRRRAAAARSTSTTSCRPAPRTPATPDPAYWRGLFGQNVIELDDLDAVCETIALTVGLGEEAIDLADGVSRPGRRRLRRRAPRSAGRWPRRAVARRGRALRAARPGRRRATGRAERAAVIDVDRPHVAVVDLGYGDAGKGTVVDAALRRRRPGAPR